MLELERPSLEHAPRQWDAQHFVKRQMDDQSTENRYRSGQAPRGAERAHPHREERRVLTQAGANEKRAADCETDGDQPGKPRRTEFLARHGGKPLDMPEDERGECDQRRAGQRIVDFYLASPTALSAAPCLASEAAMYLALS